LENFILDSIEEWKISEKVSAVVHDNAKNMYFECRKKFRGQSN